MNGAIAGMELPLLLERPSTAMALLLLVLRCLGWANWVNCGPCNTMKLLGCDVDEAVQSLGSRVRREAFCRGQSQTIVELLSGRCRGYR